MKASIGVASFVERHMGHTASSVENIERKEKNAIATGREANLVDGIESLDILPVILPGSARCGRSILTPVERAFASRTFDLRQSDGNDIRGRVWIFAATKSLK